MRLKQNRQSFLKWGFALSAMIILMIGGFAGRKATWLRLDLDPVISSADLLQQRMDESQHLFEPRPGATPVVAESAGSGWISQPAVVAQAATVKSNLAAFHRSRPRAKLPPIEEQERRLATATLANAEGRFAEALAEVPPPAEATLPPSHHVERHRLIRVIQVRADAFYGLRDWTSALAEYRRIHALHPNHVPVLGRMAECLVAQGATKEGLDAYEQWAALQVSAGHRQLVQSKPEATWHYGKALDVQRRLATQSPQSDAVSRLAMTYNFWSISQLLQNKPEAALAPLETAIGIQQHLIVDLGRTNQSLNLAQSHARLGVACFLVGKLGDAETHLGKAIETLNQTKSPNVNRSDRHRVATWLLCQGHALLGQQQLASASQKYGSAIDVLQSLGHPSTPASSILDLAMAHNSRGVARRAQGDPEGASSDFDRAWEQLLPMIESPSAANPTLGSTQDPLSEPDLRLNVALGFTGESIDVLSRARLATSTGGHAELSVSSATVRRNRGYLRLSKGLVRPAIDDFAAAASIFRKMVENEGQHDMAPQLAKSLVPLALIYAAHSDAAFRNGIQAKAVAESACELSEW
ncbi:MAG: bacterial transcriptional activator domain-containing protein, partial [Verrucomicrobiales bacterium]|nr:bacterial transcriptional activator domain-containing protein [Verrucomicrobiales bacterium]